YSSVASRQYIRTVDARHPGVSRYTPRFEPATITGYNACTDDVRYMASKSASLLTKTQRRRLRSDFEELDEDAKRRDQQLIRERVQAGIHDFRLLTDYPDRQLELAFEDDSDE